MRKIFFLSIIVAIAMVMTFVSCGNKAPQNEETPLEGTSLTQVKTPDGSLGLKVGETQVLTPTADCKSFTLLDGFVLADFGTEKKLFDPENGQELIAGSAITSKEYLFEANRGDVVTLYIPSTKQRFAANEYAYNDDFIISKFSGKIGIYKLDRTELVTPTNEYDKIVILPNGSLLVLEKKTWGTATITKNQLIQPGKTVRPRDLKKYQAMTGWNEEASVMILKK